MTYTSTHTHTVTECANPYLVCVKCGGPATKFVAFGEQAEGCVHEGLIHPCMHLESTSLCPSWSPVSGCQCANHIGYIPHKSMENVLNGYRSQGITGTVE